MYKDKVPTTGAAKGCIVAGIIMLAVALAIAITVYVSHLPPWYVGGL